MYLIKKESTKVRKLLVDRLRKYRRKMFLLVNSAVFVGIAIKVDGDTRNGKQRTSEIHQKHPKVSIAYSTTYASGH